MLQNVRMCVAFCWRVRRLRKQGEGFNLHQRIPEPFYVLMHRHTHTYTLSHMHSHTHTVIMQLHHGWMRFLQTRVLASLGCIWFNRTDIKVGAPVAMGTIKSVQLRPCISHARRCFCML